MQDHELKQTQQQLMKVVTQNDLLKKELNAFSKLKKQQEEIYNKWCRQGDLENICTKTPQNAQKSRYVNLQMTPLY